MELDLRFKQFDLTTEELILPQDENNKEEILDMYLKQMLSLSSTSGWQPTFFSVSMTKSLVFMFFRFV